MTSELYKLQVWFNPSTRVITKLNTVPATFTDASANQLIIALPADAVLQPLLADFQLYTISAAGVLNKTGTSINRVITAGTALWNSYPMALERARNSEIFETL